MMQFPDRKYGSNFEKKNLNFNLIMMDTYIFDIPIQRNFLYKNAFSLNVPIPTIFRSKNVDFHVKIKRLNWWFRYFKT